MVKKNYYPIIFWKKHQFKIIFIASLILLFICWYIDDDDPGSYSLYYHYIPIDPPKKKIERGTSRGEKECRRILEEYFQRPFAKARPHFLTNKITGKPLELDCYNDELRIACEYNGKQHYEFVKAFHNNRDSFRNQQYRDMMKQEMCLQHNITLITVPYNIPHEQIKDYLLNELKSKGF